MRFRNLQRYNYLWDGAECIIVFASLLWQVCENFVVNRNEYLSVRLFGRLLRYNFSVEFCRLSRIDSLHCLGEEIGVYISDDQSIITICNPFSVCGEVGNNGHTAHTHRFQQAD